MDRDFLVDLFADFGPVTIRPMFSGFGISVDGVNFALSLRAGLFFRADEQTSKRSVTVASYWQLPARLFDDTEEISTWAREALGAARRAALKKRPRARKSPGAAKKAAPPKASATGNNKANNKANTKAKIEIKTGKKSAKRKR
jgi:DNA transformation protein